VETTANRGGSQVKVERALNKTGEAIDDRFRAAGWGQKAMKKAFPDHWSFFLGEIALYSFFILILTGIFLTFFFHPSLAQGPYTGSYRKLDGTSMSEAYASTVNISFEVRGGLLVRQIHHWAALVFTAAIAIHCLRIFFTGAFRKPREVNWLIGTALFALAVIEGFAGYSLPDDMLSGTGVRIADGIMLSVPVIGTYLSFFVFGGQYPGDQWIQRFYIAHVLIIPGLILALVAAHVMIIWHQGHTQWPGKKQRETNEVGDPTFPVFMMKTTSLFMFVFGALALLGAVVQIDPIWLFGPYTPLNVSNGSQPDWYFGFVEGAMRLMPGVDSNLAGHTWAWNVFIPAVLLPTLFFLLMPMYPFFEQWVTGDRRRHQLLDRPRNAPTRTAFGVAVVTQASVLQLAAADDIIAFHLGIPFEGVVWFFRIGFFVFPVAGFIVTKRICITLQRADRRRLRLGTRYGIASLPAGERAAPASLEAARGTLDGERAAPEPTVAARAAADGERAAADGERTAGDGAAPQPAAAEVTAEDAVISYAAVSKPPTEEDQAILLTHRPDELITPIPRHLVPLPTPRRAIAQLRARLNHAYLLSRLEVPAQHANGTAASNGAKQEENAGKKGDDAR
jgi:ubiquinol-cytochrome c reductase cytochrome b subunit